MPRKLPLVYVTSLRKPRDEFELFPACLRLDIRPFSEAVRVPRGKSILDVLKFREAPMQFRNLYLVCECGKLYTVIGDVSRERFSAITFPENVHNESFDYDCICDALTRERENAMRGIPPPFVVYVSFERLLKETAEVMGYMARNVLGKPLR